MMMATTATLARRHSKEFKTNVMNNDDDNMADDAAPLAVVAAGTSSSSNNNTTLSDISGLLQSATAAPASVEKSLATLELQYFKAVSLYRRRNYEKCVEVCNAMLQAGHENNVQMFNTPPDEEEMDEGGGGFGAGAGAGGTSATDLTGDFKNNTYTSTTSLANMPHSGIGFGGGGMAVAGAGAGSNNSSNSHHHNVQRYGSKLQRMGAMKGRPQRGIYGNNVNSASSSSTSAVGSAASASSLGNSGNRSSAASFSFMPTWMMEGVWQLKMRALTQRIYIDDLETNDADDAGMYAFTSP